MTITLQLTPDVEQRVTQDAMARGQSVEAYLSALIADVASLPNAVEFSLDDFEADMDALAEGSDQRPVLPPDAFSRKSIYADHD
ncbi:MAG: hypothetical protein ACO1SX_03970 [Actinomycetota bacterium]